MYSVILTAVLHGIDSILVHVEADISNGMPVFDMVGSLGAEVRESRERVRTALKNCGHILPAKRITVNLTPSDIRKTGAGFDLPIAVAILSALQVLPRERSAKTLMVGQLGLSGEVLPVKGVLPMVLKAREQGCDCCIVPKENQREAEYISGIRILAVSHIGEVIAYLQGKEVPEEQNSINIEEIEVPVRDELDFADIHGQKLLKRACEVAVSGMHNILMVGPPGAGKTMAAKRIATILPPINEEEKMELAKIYSVSGMFGEWSKNRDRRPMRSPHHTITQQGMAGGGIVPRPGELSLAHRGVLFLDELTEFQRPALEVLRQPLEEKIIQINRLGGTYNYPADIMLVAAMNPCSCGYYPDMQRCHCSRRAILRYLSKISQPLIDRIDVCVEIPKIGYEELTGNQVEETSDEIRKRVLRAHEIQRERYRESACFFNSQMNISQIRTYCSLDEKTEQYMKNVYDSLNLSARSYHKVLKVARTIADLDESAFIQRKHINEAVCYRSLDQNFWGDRS